jgi:membrane-associated phospholipid phosphatase
MLVRSYTKFRTVPLVFLVYPTVGPCIFAPALFRETFHGTLTWGFMERMASEYAAVVQGRTANGTAYFVALPSLHVAMAVVLQLAVRPSPAHFWLLMPVNGLLAASTVLLGYHYVLDLPAGVATGLLGWALWGWRRV